MRRRFDFKAWEWLLIALAIFLLVGSSTLYVSGISLRRWLLGWNDDATAEQVGKMGQKKGAIRRQLNSETEFRDVNPEEPLFNYDTVVTGPDSSATLELDDGSTIELGPNTMVKLVFDSRLSLEGITRRAAVEVVAGDVAGQSKNVPIVLRARDRQVPIALSQKDRLRVSQSQTPLQGRPRVLPVVAASPSPSPRPLAPPSPSPRPSPSASPKPKITQVRIQMLTPRAGERLSIPKGSQVPKRRVVLSWTVVPLDMKLQLVIRRVSPTVALPAPGAKLPPVREDVDPVYREVITPAQGKASVTRDLERPGTYEWELRDEDGKLIHGPKGPLEFRARFGVNPEFEGIETLTPLVGGTTTMSNVYRGEHLDNFSITLRWKEYPDVEKYVIRLADRPTGGQVLVQREVKGTTYDFNKEKVFTGKVFYQVLGRLESGFLAASPPQPFSFSFMPPNLVIPENNAKVTKAMMARSDNSILMTWQKTNFTEGYEIEVASDYEFQRPVLRKRIKENFFVLKSAAPGKYFWRVRSFSKDVSSPFSRPYLLMVTP